MFFSIIGMDLTVEEALLVFLALAVIYLVSLTVHEWAHCIVAYKQGDYTPKMAGRLTLNPAKHLSFGGFLCFMIFGIGWAKPVPVNPLNFKKYRSGVAKVSLAGGRGQLFFDGCIMFFVCNAQQFGWTNQSDDVVFDFAVPLEYGNQRFFDNIQLAPNLSIGRL